MQCCGSRCGFWNWIPPDLRHWPHRSSKSGLIWHSPESSWFCLSIPASLGPVSSPAGAAMSWRLQDIRFWSPIITGTSMFMGPVTTKNDESNGTSPVFLIFSIKLHNNISGASIYRYVDEDKPVIWFPKLWENKNLLVLSCNLKINCSTMLVQDLPISVIISRLVSVSVPVIFTFLSSTSQKEKIQNLLEVFF